MVERVVLRVEELDPGPLLFEDRDHLPDHRQALRVVVAHLHLLEEPVVPGVGEVGGVGPAAGAARHRPPEQEEEVLGIGIIGHPAPEEDLVGALADLLLELVVVGGGQLDVQPEPLPRLHEEEVAKPPPGSGVPGVEGEMQRLARGRIDPVQVARLGQKPPRAIQIPSMSLERDSVPVVSVPR